MEWTIQKYFINKNKSSWFITVFYSNFQPSSVYLTSTHPNLTVPYSIHHCTWNYIYVQKTAISIIQSASINNTYTRTPTICRLDVRNVASSRPLTLLSKFLQGPRPFLLHNSANLQQIQQDCIILRLRGLLEDQFYMFIWLKELFFNNLKGPVI